MELGIPVIMAINMIDIMEKNGDSLNVIELSKKLGLEVVTISALKGNGIAKLAEKAVALASEKKKFLIAHKFNEKVEKVIDQVVAKAPDVVAPEQKRFFAIKMLEQDKKLDLIKEIHVVSGREDTF